MEPIAEWTKHYLVYRDGFRKVIKTITLQPPSVVVNYKDGKTEKYLCVENLEGSSVETHDKVVCLNSVANLKYLIKHWDSFVNTSLVFIFANPRTNQTWMVRPSVHDKVTEKKSLGKGLQALFESIPEI